MAINNQLRTQIIERDEVIRARREALRRMAGTEESEKRRIFSEFFQPLNQRLVTLNKTLGL